MDLVEKLMYLEVQNTDVPTYPMGLYVGAAPLKLAVLDYPNHRSNI